MRSNWSRPHKNFGCHERQLHKSNTIVGFLHSEFVDAFAVSRLVA